ncbi:PKD domain-containing protein [Phaeodactylibacter luteus]|uniref:T9SS type B sorting domain-containing protein n=1 Tax=Phaeodactylibacter luteus TaxID=1564516 RepID=A0A5C6S0N9_9BACT|nr:PKD domain-containing protein [Phaeodactylibacter luteus]TXB67964.1 T9SS type B sorting domain-containing protein [Phaeodactylibacter luteus]
MHKIKHSGLLFLAVCTVLHAQAQYSWDCHASYCPGEVVSLSAEEGLCPPFNWQALAGAIVINGGGPQDDYAEVELSGSPEAGVQLIATECGTGEEVVQSGSFNVLQGYLFEGAATPVTSCPGTSAVYGLSIVAPGVGVEWSASSGGALSPASSAEGEIRVSWADTASGLQWLAAEAAHFSGGCSLSDTLWFSLPPRLSLAGPSQGCTGEAAVFEANQAAVWEVRTATGEIVLSGSGEVFTLPGTLPSGHYQVGAEAAGGEGLCSPPQVLDFVLHPNGSGLLGIAGDSVICPGPHYLYQALLADTALAVYWEVADGQDTFYRSGRRLLHAFGPEPPYQVRALVKGGAVCAGAQHSLGVSPLPVLQLQGPANACNRQIVAYEVADGGNTACNWQVEPAEAATILSGQGTASVILQWHHIGFATLQVERCGQEAALQVAVNPLPVPAVVPPPAVCPGEQTTVSTALPYDGYTWSDMGGAVLSTGFAPSLPAGAYQVAVTDFNGCAADTTFRIAELPVPLAAISAEVPDTFCQSPIQVPLWAPSAEPGYTYTWLFDGQPISGASGPSIVATSPGGYQVMLANGAGCNAQSDLISIVGECFTPTPPCRGEAALVTPYGSCSVRHYEVEPNGDYVAGSGQWLIEGPGGTTLFSGLGAERAYPAPGFAQVAFTGQFLSGADTFACRLSLVDTVWLKPDFVSDTVCAGAPTALRQRVQWLGEEASASLTWSTGDGGIFTETGQLSHTYPEQGEYLASLSVQHPSGCRDTVVQAVRVAGGDSLSFEVPEARCTGGLSQFQANGEEGTRFFWDFGSPGGGVSHFDRGSVVFHQFGDPGTYTVALSGRNRLGCLSFFAQDVNVQPNTLSGQITYSDTLGCYGDTLQLMAPPGGEQAFWALGLPGDTLQVTETGLYQVTVADEAGCQYTPPIVPVVLGQALRGPVQGFLKGEDGQWLPPVADSLSVCYGQPFELRGPVGAGWAYEWADGAAGPVRTFGATDLAPGWHTFSLQVSDSLGQCLQEEQIQVRVWPAPEVTVAANQPEPLCALSGVQLDIVGPNPAWSYEWALPGIGTTSVAAATPGIYQVTVTDERGCQSVSVPIAVRARPPVLSLPSGCYGGCAPDTFAISPISGLASYQWLQNGLPMGAATPLPVPLIAEQSGQYSLEVTDTSGCSNQSAPLYLNLAPAQGAVLGQVFLDINNNGIADAADTVLADVPLVHLPGGTAYSAADGSYQIGGLPEGPLSIQIDTLALPEGISAAVVQIDTILAGCADSLALNWLLQLDCMPDTLHTALSGCSPFMFEGAAYTADTVLTSVYGALPGCDTLQLIHITVAEPSAFVLEQPVCANDSLTFMGQVLSPGDTAVFTLTNAAGCDSLLTIIAAPVALPQGSLTLQACEGDSVAYGSQWFQAGADTVLALPSPAGCDSLVELKVEALPVTFGSLSITACRGETPSFGGVPVPLGESREFILANAAGCDSLLTVSAALASDWSVEEDWVSPACPGQPDGDWGITLAGSPEPPLSYELNGTEIPPSDTLSGLFAGEYLLVVMDGTGCRDSLWGQVPEEPELNAHLSLDPDTCGTALASLQVGRYAGPGFAVAWSTGDTSLAIRLSEPGLYRASVTDACQEEHFNAVWDGQAPASAAAVYLPNAFSPNSDGANDAFGALSPPSLRWSTFELQVYDRWGGLVFQASQPDRPWDGHYRGQPLPGGAYLYTLKGVLEVCGQPRAVSRQGEVVLVR